MSFPDDYKRVQQAGGTKAQVDSTAGLPRQLLVDETNQKLLLMNGVTPGGLPVVMEKDAAAVLQNHNEIIGDALMIAKGTDGAVAGDQDTTARLWKSGELLRFFSKIVDVTLNGGQTDWTVLINNTALRDALKMSAILVANLDSAPYSGWSRCDPATALNIPAGESMGAGNTAFVLTIANSSNTQYQLYFSPKTLGKIYCRVKTAGAWGGWTLATGVTAGDLANYLLKAGDTMTGKLNLAASALGFASLKLPIGVVPTTLVEGDVWRDPVSRNIRLRKQISGVDTSIDVLDSSMIATPTDIAARTAGKLVDAAGLTGGSVLLQSTTLTSGTLAVDFTGFDHAKYREYEIRYKDIVLSAGGGLNMLLSNNGGTSWLTGATEYGWGGLIQVSNVTGGYGSAGFPLIWLTANNGADFPSTVAGYKEIDGSLNLFEPGLSTKCKLRIASLYFRAADNALADYKASASVLTAMAINGLRILPSTGNFVSGKIEIRGIAR